MKDNQGGVAAFFDLDGTLVAEPSLEREFFRELRWRGKIPVRNYFFWMAEAARLAPRGIQQILHGNKMHFRNVAEDLENKVATKNPPRFYREGIQRVEWHVRQGHAIYLVSGTLVGLASSAGLTLAKRLAQRGVHARIGFCATRLEGDCGRWTGKISGEAMFGEAKARAMRRLVRQEGFSLAKSFAYGNSVDDRWMLEAVGRASAVNPSKELEKIANLYGWAVMRWKEEESLTLRREVPSEEKKETTAHKRAKEMGLGSLG